MSGSWREFPGRLEKVEARLTGLWARHFPADRLTEPDPPTGERWEAGQVWAHVVEFVPYWLDEVRKVIDGRDRQPTAFGRTKSDPERVAAIERDRAADRATLRARSTDGLRTLRVFLLTAQDATLWSVRGVHPTLGEMTLARIVDEFLVGHLEEHADQLDGLAVS